MASSVPKWVDELRTAVKSQHRHGWSIRDMKGRVQVQRYWKTTGKRETAVLPIPWQQGITLDVLSAMAAINAAVAKGMTLKEAAALQFPAAGQTVRGTNWAEVATRFRTHKVTSGQVKEATWVKNWEPTIDLALERLAGSNAPNSAKGLLELMRFNRQGQGAPGSRGRVLRIERAAALLRFGVKECGLDSRWAPPGGEELADLKGHVAPNEKPESANAGQAVPLKDAAFLELLDSIPDKRWRLAIGLIGVFGLRGCELNHLKVEGQSLRVEYQKRTAKGLTEKRLVEALDPEGSKGLGQRLLLELSSGLTTLPPLGSSDSVVSSAISTYLNRREVWKRFRAEALQAGTRVSVYSLRHGYAYRSAMTYRLPPRAAAKLMGHSLQTHMTHYGQYVDEAGVKDAVASATARVLQNAANS